MHKPFRHCCLTHFHLAFRGTTNKAHQCAGANQGGYDLEGIADIQFHPNDPQHMLFHGLGFHHWVSTDYGKTFKVRPELSIGAYEPGLDI